MRGIAKFIAFVLLLAAAWLVWAVLAPVPPGTQSVLLRPGASSRRIAIELKNGGAIRSTAAFLLVHYARRQPLKAGEYRFEQPANLLAVYDRVARGDVYFHTVTIPEGFNQFDVAAAIEQAGLGSRADFLTAAADVSLIKDLDPEATSLEGYLFPDTYRFTRTQSMHDFVAAMVHRFKQEARALNLTNDVHRTVTMASIVEKETSAADERPMVAAVYYNRLRIKMALDADPTVIYASLLAGRYNGAIHQSELQANSPYNTYRNPGLPPGPIANPGRASLDAAMHPAEHDFLFFVSDAAGHHRFARSLDEHNHNVAMYRRATGGTAR